MRLATVPGAGGPRAAVQWGGGGEALWVDVADAAAASGEGACPTSVRGLLERDGAGLRTPRRLLELLGAGPVPAGVRTWPADGARLAAPVPDPGAFLDFYTFEEHVRRARERRGLDMVPEWYRYPVYYRSNQRAFLGTGEEVVFPAGETMMDFELELAAVLGSPIEDAGAAAAEGAIAGFTLLNDWSARGIQRETMKVGLGPSKGKDFATSLGPWLVTPDEVGALDGIVLRASVNGEVWSEGVVGRMHWRWGEMLAFASEGVRFEPGDVFGSGTVGGGCGLEQGRFLAPGDRVELDGGEVFGVLAATVRRREA